MQLIDIKNALEQQIANDLNRCGLMFRIFGRVKTVSSLAHKMEWKGDNYRSGKKKIQDMLGLRIVLYFPDDVELLGFFFSCKDLVDASVDVPGVDTFRPQRLNLVKPIPEDLVEDFRRAIPEEFAPYIDTTYEVQIRTIFSEGWHEVEHDLRYKCKDEWNEYDHFSRALNGVSATLETAEWSLSSIFREMSRCNYERLQLKAMLRNKMLIRLADNDFSPAVHDFLSTHPDVLQQLFQADRMVFLITMLSHKAQIPLTYDNVVFLINRYDVMSEELQQLEGPQTSALITAFLQS